MRSSRLPRLFAAPLLVAAFGGCQSHELEPVQPRALEISNATIVVPGRQLPPNIMLVVDTSGSMLESATGTGLACSYDGTLGSDYDARSSNPCKWNDLKRAFADPAGGFLVQSQGLGRFGLLPFPGASGTCAPGTIRVPIGDDAQPLRDQLLNKLAPGGGTPTAASLLQAAQDPALSASEPNRRRFVMLLTDGLPNCNPVNQPRCAACRADAGACALPGGCRPTEAPNACSPQPFDGAACLDDDGLVEAIAALRSQGIDTFVIGFGKATAGRDANQVLDRAAQAGGHPRRGAEVSYYQANTVEDLRRFLTEILQAFPCSFALAPSPSDPALVSVRLRETGADGTVDIPLVRGVDWEFSDPVPTGIRLLGERCRQVQDAAPGRLEVVISSAQSL